MAKGTVGLRAADGSTVSHARETLAGASHLIQHVATAMPTVVSCQQITATGTSATLAALCSSAVLPSGATHALVRADSANTAVIRFWDDGTTPTAAIGIEMAAGDVFEWAALGNIKLITVTGSQKLNISFRKFDA